MRILRVVPSISEVRTPGGSLSVKDSDEEGVPEWYSIRPAKIEVRPVGMRDGEWCRGR